MLELADALDPTFGTMVKPAEARPWLHNGSDARTPRGARMRAVRARKNEETQGLRHIALKTREIAATERFYIDVLGFEIAFPHRGMIFLKTPGGDDLLNFVSTRKAFDAKAGGLDHFGVHIPREHWKKLKESLDRAGVAIKGRRGHSAVYIQDPNGYTVELTCD
jgi:catechol 2,3-dioxygenase-like lactoylglutathione lyase family enzyme